MNNENLIPFSKGSVDEPREKGRKGGINSGKARREQKRLKQTALMMLNALLDESTEQARTNKNNIKNKFGLKAGDVDYNSAIIAVQIAKALKGDLKSAMWLQDVSNQLNAQKHEVTGKDGEALISGLSIEVIDSRDKVKKQQEDGADTDTDNTGVCGD